MGFFSCRPGVGLSLMAIVEPDARPTVWAHIEDAAVKLDPLSLAGRSFTWTLGAGVLVWANDLETEGDAATRQRQHDCLNCVNLAAQLAAGGCTIAQALGAPLGILYRTGHAVAPAIIRQVRRPLTEHRF